MFLQFELWKDCAHGCPFCCNIGIRPVRDKAESLRYTQQIINETGPCDSISLIGGEFFDRQLKGPYVDSLFYGLVDSIAGRIKDGSTSRGLVCTSLMYEDTSELHRFCSVLQSEGVLNRFLLCTSWDVLYRFNEVTLANWQRNMVELKSVYPELNLHVEMIMTQAFLASYLRGELTIKEFEDEWQCRVDFNTPYKPFEKYSTKAGMQKDLPLFFPNRKDFFRFLSLAHRTSDVELGNLQNVNLHSSCLHYTLNDVDWIPLVDRHDKRHTCLRQGPCRRNCCGYIDSEKKMHEDIQDFLDASA